MNVAYLDCRTPRWRARQVISSPSARRPVVLPATARSPVAVVDRTWSSTLRARSKHSSRGAAMGVDLVADPGLAMRLPVAVRILLAEICRD